VNRVQITLFAPTLDDSVAEDHSVPLFDETLRGISFGEREWMDVRVAGQQPIHPGSMAGGATASLASALRRISRMICSLQTTRDVKSEIFRPQSGALRDPC
jgi:hypothetical protein